MPALGLLCEVPPHVRSSDCSVMPFLVVMVILLPSFSTFLGTPRISLFWPSSLGSSSCFWLTWVTRIHSMKADGQEEKDLGIFISLIFMWHCVLAVAVLLTCLVLLSCCYNFMFDYTFSSDWFFLYAFKSRAANFFYYFLLRAHDCILSHCPISAHLLKS